jgi:hypothetical protein
MKKEFFRKVITLLLVAFAFSMLLFTKGYAQGTSVISGSVVDPQSKVIAGATVTIKNAANNFSRTQVTDSSGNFNFSSLPPGTYTLEVEAQGFKKAVSNQVEALVAKTTSLVITLEVGAPTETVNVTASTVDTLVNTSDASLGNNFVSKQILELPLNARNVGDLLSLQPAVTRDGYVAGGRADQANLTLDGVDVNEQVAGSTFQPILRVNPDSVDEFRVETINSDATKGRSSGAQVQFVTKRGDNQFRGALYEYHRNTVTTANDYFNNAAGLPRPALIRNLFGGRIGGPIVKDRFFFFYNYEGLREAKQTTVNRIVPLASMGQGQLRFYDANSNIVTLTAAQINALTTGAGGTGNPVVDVNPVVTAIFASAAARYPANNFRLGDGLNTGGFQFNAPLPVELDAHTLRLDWRLKDNDSQTITFRGNYQQDLFASAPAFPDTPAGNTWSHPVGIVVGHTWVINSQMVNNFKFGLTRDAFTILGDSNQNAITFRDVFSPLLFSRTFSRVTPVMNFTDDFSWTRGDHTWQFGTNIRTIRNRRVNFAQSFDNGITNSSFYASSGAVVTAPLTANGYTIRSDFRLVTQRALTGLFGRLSQYGANFNFSLNGQPLAPGTGVERTFASEEYDVYVQDTWKIKPTLTATLGLRYGLSRPVYEMNGYQAAPNVSMKEYLERRIAASFNGQNYDVPLLVELIGPANGKRDFYPWDKNNFQPRVSLAWSPNFRSGFLGKIFGADQTSVLRGGFSITNDYFGQALAVNFDGNNRLGFASNQTIAANTYNVSTNPGPLVTGLGMRINNLPGITIPGNLTFPQQQPSNFARRIEGSLDSNLVSPINYSWNLSYGRKFGAEIYVEVSYIARIARNLLAARDVFAPNNLRDPASGMDWYTAAGILETLRVNRTPMSQIPNMPYFNNLWTPGSLDTIFFNGLGLTNTQVVYGLMATNDTVGCEPTNPLTSGCYEFGTDWTFAQDVLDRFSGRRLFYQSQYGALSAYGTIGSSDYHGGSISVRQRFKGLTWDFNYTLSKSMDDASGLQTSGVFGSAFILNALRQRDNRDLSDFDVRHIVNFNSIWEIPVGKGRRFLNDSPGWVNVLLGGWQLATIFRFNSGELVGTPFDVAGWPTNWNVRSNNVRIRDISSSPCASCNNGNPNLFSNPKEAYRSFRSPRPGETGDRNLLRYPSYFVLDAGLSKSFTMPWNENHKIQFRWETFNVTNSARLTGIADFSMGLDPQRNGIPGPTFGNFTGVQGDKRVMQFAIRYDF